MRAWVLSDLHVDRARVELGRHPDHDVILMAGDLCDGGYDPTDWLLDTFSMQELSRLVYVEGNHDRYGLGIDVEPPHIEAMRSLGIHAGRRGEVVLMGHRIVYATLWSDIDIPVAGEALGDFKRIPKLTQQAWREAHQEDMAWLRSAVYPGDTVMTHHAPTFAGLHPAISESSERFVWASSYASRLDPEIAEMEPSLWVFGHTHVSMSATVGSTKLLSNARGRGSATHFDPGLVVRLFDPGSIAVKAYT